MLLSVLPDVFFEKKQYIHEPGTGQKKNSFELPEFEPLEDILKKDQEDESLNKYKQTLLGGLADVKDPCMSSINSILNIDVCCLIIIFIDEPTKSFGIKTEYMPRAAVQKGIFNCLAYDWALKNE
jgi:hypothetical protein